ncbi:Substrate-binding region of ABC-type glycine betaine transport system [Segniliparus rotundus DSM 44985]|uniref:Substrate-binding region of ABC-type glycine betaine transport system n=1 Tax=Segniliparus rotundus (strain ATCC BAA-972 / CDC 1076 / CIP 108378 / DSM 44985 / JCM 13578) TaxID=640132 RepID=D6ZC77_SEGRD|nr:ABC transporter substrate-binding protein [Segniliparus rotundus]ADG99046.1 Substrate-binding region of ABC-type glycine betaine transport system [Segniliparus rotundus DSM 44985]
MRSRTGFAATVTALALLSACGTSSDPFSSGAETDSDPSTITVGSAASPESEVIADIYIQALRANGFHAGGKQGVGQREGYIPALSSGEISVIPEYTGNLLRYVNKAAKAVTAEQIKIELDQALVSVKLVAYTPAPASNTDSITVTKKLAQSWGLSSIADLAAHVAEFEVAGNAEFQQRHEGLAGLKDVYGIDVPADHFMAINDSSGPATIEALRKNQAQGADVYTTTPALAEGDLLVLDDPKGLFPPNNVVPVVSLRKDSPKLRRVLDAVSAQLTTQDLTMLNRAISGQGEQEPEDAAAAWLKAHSLDHRLAEK